MANPNPAVWGSSDTWLYAKYTGGDTSQTAADLKCDAPKIANFGGTDDNMVGSLGRGVTYNRVTANEPVDLTICPCGQDPAVSAYGKLAVLNEDGEISLTPRVIERTQPVNWCFCDMLTDTLRVPERFAVYKDYTYSFSRGMKYDQWSPKAVNGGYNNSYYMSPYVSWQIRSILLSIEVECITGETAAAINTTWRTLDDWKNNHNTDHICGVRCFNRAVNSISGDTLSYITSSLSQYRYSGKAAILDPIPDISNDSEYTDTTFYTFLTGSDRGRYTYLFCDVPNIFANTRIGILPAWDMFTGQTLNKAGDSQSGFTYYYKIPYSDNNYEVIMQMVACFGCYFTPSSKYSFNVVMTDTDLCLPVIDDGGVAHGEYTRGSGNIDNDLYDKDSIRDKDYDPSKHYDPNTYSDTTSWNDVNLQGTFCKRYELTAAQVGQLAEELWSAQASKPADIDYHNFAIDEYLTNNPIDTIVSLKYFPCNVETAANPAIVHLGKYQTQIAANGISHTVKVIDYAPIEVFPHFNDFRDYEPYTTLQMYIPFCGTVQIPTAETMGKYVSVKLCIDIGTGACAGYVIVSKTGSGGICVATATGTASIDIPVSGLQSANLSQAIFNATANWTQTQISNAKVTTGLLHHFGELSDNARLMSKGMAGNLGIGDIASGLTGTGGTGGIFNIGRTLSKLDPVQGMYNGMSMEIESSKSDYELSHIMLPMRLIGSTSPVLSSVIESSCRLIIYRPVTDESALSEYADTVGYATVSSGTVSQFTGYTEGTIDVRGINATASEKSEIQRLFAGGVYL